LKEYRTVVTKEPAISEVTMNFVPHPEFRPFSVADKPPLKTTTIEPTTVNGSRMHTSGHKPGMKTTTIEPAAGRTRLRDRG
jgi:hypothetical protein